MSVDRARHGRQIRLAEIGEAGQARLASAHAVLRSSGAARTIETAYLRAAGVGVDDVDAGDAAAAAGGASGGADAVLRQEETLGLTDPTARDVARGALAALIAMREILGVSA